MKFNKDVTPDEFAKLNKLLSSFEKKEVKKKGKPLPCDSPDEEEFEKQQAKMHQQELRIKDLSGELEIAKKNMKEINSLYEQCLRDYEESVNLKVVDLQTVNNFLKWIKSRSPDDYQSQRNVWNLINTRNGNTAIINHILMLFQCYLDDMKRGVVV